MRNPPYPADLLIGKCRLEAVIEPEPDALLFLASSVHLR
jgi:hypothetical protein